MTTPTQVNTSAPQQEQPKNDKEINFRLQEKAMQDKYERLLAQERSARAEAEKKVEESRRHVPNDEDDDSEPYVDHKKLKREQAKFGQEIKQQTQSDINTAVQAALRDERKQNWIKNNGDFYEVLQHAEKLAQHDPELADTILEMPESFERQKLVYKSVKALGLHKDAPKQPSIQEKVDANRRSPYYQPSGVGSSPYASQSDFSSGGQKQAYDKMKQLQAQLRL